MIEENGARLFRIPKSYLYLHETTLDYQEDLMRRGFGFQNPQATRSWWLRQFVHRLIEGIALTET